MNSQQASSLGFLMHRHELVLDKTGRNVACRGIDPGVLFLGTPWGLINGGGLSLTSYIDDQHSASQSRKFCLLLGGTPPVDETWFCGFPFGCHRGLRARFKYTYVHYRYESVKHLGLLVLARAGAPGHPIV